jgi:hypothetical protein
MRGITPFIVRVDARRARVDTSSLEDAAAGLKCSRFALQRGGTGHDDDEDVDAVHSNGVHAPLGETPVSTAGHFRAIGPCRITPPRNTGAADAVPVIKQERTLEQRCVYA